MTGERKSRRATGDRIETATRRTATWVARLGGALIFLIALLVFGDILARNIFNRTLFHSFEFSIYLFAIAVSFGFASTLVEGAHIRIDVVYAQFGRRTRRALDFLALISVTLVATFFAERAWQLVATSASQGVTSNTALAVPLAIPQAAWALGFSFFAVVSALLTIRHAFLVLTDRGLIADRIGAAMPESSIAGVDQPDNVEAAR